MGVRLICAALATGLFGAWLWLLMSAQKIDWRMAAYCKRLQNTQKIESLEKQEEANRKRVQDSYGAMQTLLRMVVKTDYSKQIQKLQRENEDLAHGRLKKINLLLLPGFAVVRKYPQLTHGGIYKKILTNCFELYGKKYAPYKAKETLAEMASYLLLGLALIFGIGTLEVSTGNQTGAVAVFLFGTLILAVLLYALFDTTKDLAEKRMSWIMPSRRKQRTVHSLTAATPSRLPNLALPSCRIFPRETRRSDGCCGRCPRKCGPNGGILPSAIRKKQTPS